MTEPETLDELVGEVVNIVLVYQGAGAGGPHEAVKELILKVLTPYSEANEDLADENRMWMTVALDRKTEIENLERWKAEMLPVLEGMQELGKALNLPLGAQISGPAALAAVEEKKRAIQVFIEKIGDLEAERIQLKADLESWKAEAMDHRDGCLG